MLVWQTPEWKDMMSRRSIGYSLNVAEDDSWATYIRIKWEGETEPPKSVRTVRLVDLMPECKGVDVVFDFADDGRLIGIELMGD